jgi:SAM-dependent methyltransferase
MNPLCYKTEHFATHQPVLLELLKVTTGPILELGCGIGSSLLLKHFITEDRDVYCVESNREWLERMRRIEAENYKMFFLDAGNEDNDATGKMWVDFCEKHFSGIAFDIVFIDQSPWTARTHTMNYFLNRAKYIVVHDADYFPLNNRWGKIIETVKETPTHTIHKCEFTDVSVNSHLFYPPENFFPMKTGPPTLILSNNVMKQEFSNFITMLEKSKAVYYQ